jgi:predicted RNA-binding protein YlxR (DUF448 family)
MRRPQHELQRFVRSGATWNADPPDKPRQPGRGAYLCSSGCAARTAKNKRYPGLSAAAAEYRFSENDSMTKTTSIGNVGNHAP